MECFLIFFAVCQWLESSLLYPVSVCDLAEQGVETTLVRNGIVWRAIPSPCVYIILCPSVPIAAADADYI